MAISASNAVLQSIETACAIYGVRSYRMNTRAMSVVGVGGKERPMFFGSWKDANGELHRKGMADLFLTPKIPLKKLVETDSGLRFCVPLWVECKSGSGKLTEDQKLFRADVIEAGAFYIEAHDSADAVVEWFRQYGVTR
jgi:hypothetical protein